MHYINVSVFGSHFKIVFTMKVYFLLWILVVLNRLVVNANSCKNVTRVPDFPAAQYDNFLAILNQSKLFIIKPTLFLRKDQLVCYIENTLQMLFLTAPSKGLMLFVPFENCIFFHLWKDGQGNLRAKSSGIFASESIMGSYKDPDSGDRMLYLTKETPQLLVQQYRVVQRITVSFKDENHMMQQFCDTCLMGNCTEIEDILQQPSASVEKKVQWKPVGAVLLVIAIFLAAVWASLERSIEAV